MTLQSQKVKTAARMDHTSILGASEKNGLLNKPKQAGFG